MAKVRHTIMPLVGTIGGINYYVDSKNRVIARTARRKATPINEAMQESSNKLKNANLYAKPLYNALKGEVENIKFTNDNWTKLLSHIRQQIKINGVPDLRSYRHYTIAPRQSLTRILSLCHEADVNWELRQLSVMISKDTRAYFPKSSKITDYTLRVIAIFFDASGFVTHHTGETVSMSVNSMRANDKHLVLTIPPNAVALMLVANCNSFFYDGAASLNLRTNGVGTLGVFVREEKSGT